MSLGEVTINKISSIASGSLPKKIIFAPIVGTIFSIITYLFVAVPVYLDTLLKIPKLWQEPLNYFLSLPFFIIGIVPLVWSVFYFFKSKATPVPVYPPPRLITSGPYAYSRNPMHTGLILIMFGAGFYFGSWLSVLVFTPVYVLIDVMIIKRIEEPELEKRLGKDYAKYKKRIPMFFPWKSNS